MNEIIVYGTGSFFSKYRDQLEKEYKVIECFDKTRYPNNANSVLAKLTSDFCDVQVIVMIENIMYVFQVVETLINCGVDPNRIILGISKYGQYSELQNIYVDEDGRLHIKNHDIDLIVNSSDEFYNAIDTILFDCYKYHLYTDKEQIVIDVGMNIADASCYFAKNEKVNKVYSFEPFKKTYDVALKNISGNMLNDKICAYQFGLSNENADREILFFQDMSCGQSTMEQFNKNALDNYKELGILDGNNYVSEKINVRKSSEVISEIIQKHGLAAYVLKLDCEGEEYQIIGDLEESGLLNAFSLIMLEWHYCTDKRLIDAFQREKFSYVSSRKSLVPDLGLITAFNNCIYRGGK